MIRIRELKIPLDGDLDEIRSAAAKRLHIDPAEILSIRISKKAVDARKKAFVHFNVSADIELKNEKKLMPRINKEPTAGIIEAPVFRTPNVISSKSRPVIVCSGPAGLFAAWYLALAGAKPIVLERGLDVDLRAEKISRFWQSGELDPDCNIQFGEGGAGTFSDGKLTTGMKDRRTGLVLKLFVECGAPEDILYSAKPHIGTDMLRITIKNLRERIKSLGGEFIFGARFCDFTFSKGALNSLSFIKDGTVTQLDTENLILAVGHSARDVFELLHEKGITLVQKPFSVGVRMEHSQRWLNEAMYGSFAEHPALHAADYKLAVHLPNGRGVYTFCMCPGGSVVAAASEPGGVVTNGMSLYARDGENSNAAILVGVDTSDFGSEHPLAGIELQRRLERAAFRVGGGNYSAPAICFGDFIAHRPASGFGSVMPSYLPGVTPASPDEYLPPFVCDSLRSGITLFGQKIHGFDAPESVLTGVESRSSSPVRILRDESMQSASLRGLYPCGEGAGYAGGIMSAAVDGLKCAEAVVEKINRRNINAR